MDNLNVIIKCLLCKNEIQLFIYYSVKTYLFDLIFYFCVFNKAKKKKDVFILIWIPEYSIVIFSRIYEYQNLR